MKTAQAYSDRRGLPALLLLVGLTLTPALVGAGKTAQEPASKGDFLRRVFLTEEFATRYPGPSRWLNGGDAYTTIEPSSTMKDGADLVRYATATGKRDVVVSAADLIPSGATKPIAIEGYDWSKDNQRLLIYTNSQRVWRQNTRGDYWAYDMGTKKLHKLGGNAPASTLMFGKFSSDGSKVGFARANNIYVEDVASGSITQLTHDGSDTIVNGTSDWVYEEELDIRDGFRWSPDATKIAYWQFDTSTVRNFALIYNVGGPYDVVTQIPYPEFGVYPLVKQIPIPQPGTANSKVRIGVVAAQGGETRWMRVIGDPEKSYIARMDWADDSNSLVIEHLNRRQDTNDVVLADATTGTAKVVHTEHDKAWVDVVDEVRWVHGAKDFLWLSEQDGWRHVYTISRDGSQVKLVTHGTYDVTDVVRVDPAEEWLYFMASPDDPKRRYLYRTKLDGSGAAERLTPSSEPGMHGYDISPNAQWAIDFRMTIDSSPVFKLEHLPDLHAVRTMEDNAALRAKVKDLFAQPTEFLKVDIGEGVVLDAWMIKPKQFDPAKRYPVLVYIYGEPAGQTVIDAWDGEAGLFHRYLAERGYVILSIDNRGTPAPRGRDWRKIIYGSVGVLSSKEQAAALRKLEQTCSFLDAARVAVWGWSGGGTNTLNLMFRSPELYKVGMSVAPVPDQRLYDTIYQERYMGLPQENVNGYQSSSAINFADGLQGHLLIVHSPGDDNVHFQGTELLINRLVELGKPFDFMEYPGRTHGLSEGAGTHYHLFSLLARYLEEHLPPGPAAKR